MINSSALSIDNKASLLRAHKLSGFHPIPKKYGSETDSFICC